MEAFRCPRAWGWAPSFHSTTSSRPPVIRGSAKHGAHTVERSSGCGRGIGPRPRPFLQRLPPSASSRFSVPSTPGSQILEEHHNPALPCGAQVGALNGALSQGCWKDRIQGYSGEMGLTDSPGGDRSQDRRCCRF